MLKRSSKVQLLPYCIIFALLSASAVCQAQPNVPEVVDMIAEYDPRMTVQVRVNDKADHNFIIDTAADRSVISAEVAGEMQLASSTPVKLHAINGSDIVPTVIIASLGVASTTINNIRAPALAARHIGADGVLGIDSLQKKRILIDFRNEKMTISESEAAEPKYDGDLIVVLARSRFGQLILVDADVDGQKIHVILDTGAEHSVGNAKLQRIVARRDGSNIRTIGLMGVTGDTTNADYTYIKRIRIGGFTITNAPIAFAELHPFKRFGLTRKPALLLGMDVLRKFDRVSIDFASRKIKFLLPHEPMAQNSALTASSSNEASGQYAGAAISSGF